MDSPEENNQQQQHAQHFQESPLGEAFLSPLSKPSSKESTYFIALSGESAAGDSLGNGSSDYDTFDDFYSEVDTPRSRTRSYSDGVDPSNDTMPQLPVYNPQSQRSILSAVSSVTAGESPIGLPPPSLKDLFKQESESVLHSSRPNLSSHGKPSSLKNWSDKLNKPAGTTVQIRMDGSIHETPLKSVEMPVDIKTPEKQHLSSTPAASMDTDTSLLGTTTQQSTNTLKSLDDITPKKPDGDDLDEHETNSDYRPSFIFYGDYRPSYMLAEAVRGFRFTVWAHRRPPSLNRISTFVVRKAPCFWCHGNRSGTSTDRAIVTRLNILVTFFAFIQLAASIWLATTIIFIDEEEYLLDGFAPHFWNLNGITFSIGVLAVVIITTCFSTARVIQDVDLVGAIRYLWIALWIIPFEVFFNISLFDYHRVTKVWLKHWWLVGNLSWFRYHSCRNGTAETLCMVPIDGGDEFASEDEWCLHFYNSTECTQVRNDAQRAVDFSLMTFYSILAVWGCFLTFLMLLMVNSLQRIISKPIVQKSRETNVPAWLTLPIVGCGVVGAILLYSRSSLLSNSSGSKSSWIGLAYILSGALFLIAALVGWFISTFTIRNSVDKKNKNLAIIVFCGIMATNAFMLATLFVSSIAFSADLARIPLQRDLIAEVSCSLIPNNSCTLCDVPELGSGRCPEWTVTDVTKILRTQLKQSATLAAIFIMYAISVLKFGFGLRKHLAMYQIDYV